MDWQEVTISRRKLSWNAKAYHRLVWACPNFLEKTFTGGSKTAKFVNVFSLESFVLYGRWEAELGGISSAKIISK